MLTKIKVNNMLDILNSLLMVLTEAERVQGGGIKYIMISEELADELAERLKEYMELDNKR